MEAEVQPIKRPLAGLNEYNLARETPDQRREKRLNIVVFVQLSCLLCIPIPAIATLLDIYIQDSSSGNHLNYVTFLLPKIQGNTPKDQVKIRWTGIDHQKGKNVEFESPSL